MALEKIYGDQRRAASTPTAAGTLIWPNQAVRTFLAGRNLAELALLWSIHVLLATVILVPGTPLDALRPVVAFVYLLIVPGLLLVRLLRVYQEDPLAQLVTAVGLSLIYDMVLGLLLSGIPSAVIERPLDAEVFLPTSLLITGVLSLAVRSEQSLLAPFVKFARPSSLAWALLPLAAVFVALHVRGGGATLWMVVLLAVIAATPLLLLVRRPTAAECAVALFSICLALAFHKYFVSPELPGWDGRREAFFASQVLDAGRWSPQSSHIYQAMLSITVLPTVASEAVGVHLATTFKIFFSVVLALIPVTLFLALKNWFSVHWALLAAFLYLGHYVFSVVMLNVARQTVATFLLVLLILTITKVEGRAVHVRALQLALALGVIFSHYSTAPFMLIAFGTILLLTLLVRHRVPLDQYQTEALPSLGTLLAVSIFAYVWFSWASGDRVFTAFVVNGQRIAMGIANDLLFNHQAITVSAGLIPPGVSYKMLLFANWAIVLTSLTGFAICLYGVVRRDRLRTNLAIMGSAGILLGGFFFLLPQTTESLTISRVFFMILLWLLPLLIYGLKWAIQTSRVTMILPGRIPAVLAAVGLLVYTALGTGMVTHLAGDPDFSYALDRDQVLTFYDEAAARFVSSYRATELKIYGDEIGRAVFIIVDPSKAAVLSNPRLPSTSVDGFYLYFRKVNLEGQWPKPAAAFFHSADIDETEMLPFLTSLSERMSLAYNSGGAELYFSVGELSARATPERTG